MMGRRITHKALRPGVETLKTGRVLQFSVLQFYSSTVLTFSSSCSHQQTPPTYIRSFIPPSTFHSQSLFSVYKSSLSSVIPVQSCLFFVRPEQFILRYSRVVYSPLYQSSLFSVIPYQFILRCTRVVYSPLYQSYFFFVRPEQFILRYPELFFLRQTRVVYSPLYQSS